MIHSVICWDCSFRNFFNTIDGLLIQDYDRNQFELVFVEQRSKDIADEFNHSLGLKSLWDRFLEVQDSINMKVFYLDDSRENPYHLGRTVNFGLSQVKGEIVSVMDGDLLLPKDFLSKLEEYHRKSGNAIVNLLRLDANQPVGVTKKNWIDATIEYQACLALCKEPPDPFPITLTNKGPLISALKDNWEIIDGYDNHLIWSTGLSRLGQDISNRLEMAMGVQSTALPNRFAVHPWHPAGFHRETVDSQRMLDIQESLIKWSKSEKEISWIPRTSFTESMYTKNKNFVDKMIYSDLMNPGKASLSSVNFKSKASILINKSKRKIEKSLDLFRKPGRKM